MAAGGGKANSKTGEFVDLGYSRMGLRASGRARPYASGQYSCFLFCFGKPAEALREKLVDDEGADEPRANAIALGGHVAAVGEERGIVWKCG